MSPVKNKARKNWVYRPKTNRLCISFQGVRGRGLGGLCSSLLCRVNVAGNTKTLCSKTDRDARDFTSCPGVSSSCSSWVVDSGRDPSYRDPCRGPCRGPYQVPYRVPCQVRSRPVVVHRKGQVLWVGQERRSPVGVPDLLGLPVPCVQVVRMVVGQGLRGLRSRLARVPEGRGRAVAAGFSSRRLARNRPCRRPQSSRSQAAGGNPGSRSSSGGAWSATHPQGTAPRYRVHSFRTGCR